MDESPVGRTVWFVIGETVDVWENMDLICSRSRLNVVEYLRKKLL